MQASERWCSLLAVPVTARRGVPFPYSGDFTPYATTPWTGPAKTFTMALLRSFHTIGIGPVALRYFNVYGPEWI